MRASTSPAAPRRARYREIETYLRDLVAGGRPGDPLPSEAELCARFGVSRMTVRQALAVLGNEGMVERRRGQGTFVGHPLLHRQPGQLVSFSEETARRGLVPSSRVLEARLDAATPEEVAELRLEPAEEGAAGGARVVRVVRVRCADALPVAIERAALVPGLAPVLDADLAGGSLHQAVTRLGVEPTRAVGSLSARLASAEEARHLDLEVPAAILVEVQVMLDAAGAPFERTETAYVGERYAVDTIHTRS